MTKFKLGTIGSLAIAIFSFPKCGGNSETGSNSSTTGGYELTGTGGTPPLFQTGGRPPTGGIGGVVVGAGGNIAIPMGTGGIIYLTAGGVREVPVPATGGTRAAPAAGGADTGVMPATGGRATGGAPANGHQCICDLADSLSPPSAACISDTPNVCTLRKAYCGQTCASQSTDAGLSTEEASSSTNCDLNCVAGFSSVTFTDLSTYTSGSCTVTIRCP